MSLHVHLQRNPRSSSSQAMNNQLESTPSPALRLAVISDLDGTLHQGGLLDERHHFCTEIAPRLTSLMAHGARVVAITGNCLAAVTHRSLRWIVETLVEEERLFLLPQFQIYANNGATRVAFSAADPDLRELFDLNRTGALTSHEAFDRLVRCRGPADVELMPRFVDCEYLLGTRIREEEARSVSRILEEAAREYDANVLGPSVAGLRCRGTGTTTRCEVRASFPTDDQGTPKSPSVVHRRVLCGKDMAPQAVTSQLTLKPVLTNHHLTTPRDVDPRNALVASIQKLLDEANLGHLEATPGGRTSIDISKRGVDKGAALRDAIGRTGVRGDPRRGERFGEHCLYLGDEILERGGNDEPVSRVAGVLTVSVGRGCPAPSRRGVITLPRGLHGPAAAAWILARLCAGIEKLPAPLVLPSLRQELVRDNIHASLDAWIVGGGSAAVLENLNLLLARIRCGDEAARDALALAVKDARDETHRRAS